MRTQYLYFVVGTTQHVVGTYINIKEKSYSATGIRLVSEFYSVELFCRGNDYYENERLHRENKYLYCCGTNRTCDGIIIWCSYSFNFVGTS